MTKKMKTDIETIYSLKYADYLEECRKRDSAKVSGDMEQFENLAEICSALSWKLAGMGEMVQDLGYQIIYEGCNCFKVKPIPKEED